MNNYVEPRACTFLYDLSWSPENYPLFDSAFCVISRFAGVVRNGEPKKKKKKRNNGLT